MPAFELSDLDEVTANFAYTKPDGSAGDIDLSGGKPDVTVSDPSALTVELADDAMSALCTSGDDLPADAPVDCSFPVDVDLGQGVRTIQVQWSMLIKSHSAGQVSTVNVGFGTPTPKS
jgi:hypothetical protein